MPNEIAQHSLTGRKQEWRDRKFSGRTDRLNGIVNASDNDVRDQRNQEVSDVGSWGVLVLPFALQFDPAGS